MTLSHPIMVSIDLVDRRHLTHGNRTPLLALWHQIQGKVSETRGIYLE